MNETCSDQGHNQLLLDLQSLLKEAQSFAFHDFKNEEYATPKVALAQKLYELRENVKKGVYDN